MFRASKTKKANIVMLGNSITDEANWNELLGRTDIANRGIGGDITEGFLNRLDDVYTLYPNYCFIMGGINDITRGISTDTAFSNYIKIIKDLQAHGITPVIQTTLYICHNRFFNTKQVNIEVDKLNKMLKRYATEHDIMILDINSLLAKDGILNPDFSSDGVHLLADGYKVWRDVLLEFVEEL